MSAEHGLTRPGAFLFELLGRCGINAASWRVLQGCLDSAMELLMEEAVEAGRRYADGAPPLRTPLLCRGTTREAAGRQPVLGRRPLLLALSSAAMQSLVGGVLAALARCARCA